MTNVDWAIVVVYFLLSFGVAAYYSKRAGKGTGEFFLSGRNLPWWLAGTSMVATTFAADTPLAITEIVAKNGIAGNWLWWNFLFGSMFTTFFFARLWRRADVLTDVEFIELRYSGKPASFLRGFRALYLGLFINTIVIGWVNVAMAAVLVGMFDIPQEEVRYYIFLAMAFVAIYSSLSGLWGVVVTDILQFIVAMSGTLILAVIVIRLPQIGGIDGLKSQLPESIFRFTPTIGLGAERMAFEGVLILSVSAFVAYIFIQWWAAWYPGAEPGGGGYIAQRMMSSRDEKHALLATLWFNIAHFCLRPWPWILVGLASLVLYPELELADKKLGYVYAMRDFLPAGFKGLLVAAFFAAYMSTVATQLNWGTSYLVNDFYQRFIRPTATEMHYVLASRITTMIVMIASILVTLIIQTISGAWQFVIEAGAGLGLVLILRFYWWRINAWSEVSATVMPFFVYAWIKGYTDITFPDSLFYIVGITTCFWVLITFVTAPVNEQHLIKFYQRVYPGGVGWRKISAQVSGVKKNPDFSWLFLDWICGVILVYMILFGVGKIVLGNELLGMTFLGLGLVAGSIIYWDLSRRGWKDVTGKH